MTKRCVLVRAVMLMFLISIVMPIAVACTKEKKDKYIFTYYVGESVYYEKKYDSLSDVKLPEDPVVEGKTFMGWYFDKGVWEDRLELDALSDKTHGKQKNYTIYALFIDNNQGTGDRYLELKRTERSPIKIIDLESEVFLENNNTLEVSEKDGKKVFKWVANKNIKLTPLQVFDISSAETIKFSIYSEANTGKSYHLRLTNPNPVEGSTARTPYYRIEFTIDFVGWKNFEIDVSKLSGNYDPMLNKIDYAYLDASGWGYTADANTIIYFTSVCADVYDYSVECSEDVSITDASIYREITSNYRELLVGTEIGSTSTEYVSRINKISNNCKTAWQEFKDTYTYGVKDSLFNISITHGNVGDEAKIATIYSKLLAMATGYGTAGSSYYHNQELLEDIKKGLKYTYDYYYGMNVLEDEIYGNWWQWEIGTPLNLIPILCIIENELSSNLIKRYLAPFDYLIPLPKGTACNLVWMTKLVTISAALQHDAIRLLRATERCEEVFDYVTSGDGFYEDGSFVQHTNHAYTAGYGMSTISEITNIMCFLDDTPFEWRAENINNQYRWVFENYRPCIYGANFMSAMKGREVSRDNNSEQSLLASFVITLIRMQSYAPTEVKGQIEGLILYYMRAANTNYTSSVSLNLVDYCVDLYNSEKKPTGDYYATKIFANMDRVVYHGEEFGFALSLSSDRIYKYESINNENKTGWYLGDGMVYIYTEDYDYDSDFYQNDNPYLMPGTTVNSAVRNAVCPSPQLFNSSSFAGGVSSGKYGVAGFELGYNVEKNGVDASSSTFNSNLDASITAKKSYFLFDNEIVCLGSNIEDQSTTQVRTVVENRKWREGDVLTINGLEALPEAILTEVEDAKTMHFTNMGGYVFLENTAKVNCAKAEGTQDFLQITLEHGKGEEGLNGGYAYAYLPEATIQETEEYNQNSDILILQRNQDIHAVLEKSLGALGAVFFNAGTLTNTNGISIVSSITTDGGCTIIITKNADGSTKISVSDPTHLRENMQITLTTTANHIIRSDEGVTTSINNGTVTLNINSKGSLGKTYEVVIK